MEDYEKRERIRFALSYREGEDSCNNVYMGSMATANIFHALGGRYGRDDINNLLVAATAMQLDLAIALCDSFLKFADANPRYHCFSCGQITETPQPAQDAVDAVIRYIEMRKAQPLRGLGDSIHVIHAGTEFEAELKFSDLEALVAALKRKE